MVKIECIDINHEVSLLSSYLAMLRQWQSEIVLHIMGYLSLKHNSWLFFHPSFSVIDQKNFQERNWTDFYEYVVKPIPLNSPLLRDKMVDLHIFVDSDHADEKQQPRWSKTRFVMYEQVFD